MPPVTTDEQAAYERELASRRQAYLSWIVGTFAPLEPTLKPLDGRLWSLNHARLVLDQGTERASRYFETVTLTADRDFMGTRLLKTFLDFRDSPRLSEEAKQHLRSILAGWEMNDFSRYAVWPRQHTENHDIMFLTIGLFSEQLRGQDIEEHLNEVRQSLMWRFERGFFEWNSHRYQYHYTNPLQILAVHAPAADIRQGAEALLNLILAERAVLGVGGYLGGPFMRGYDAERGCDYLDDNRYDAFLPTMWLAFGTGEPRFDYAASDGLEPAGDGFGGGTDPRLNQDEGMFFATSGLVPHPVVRALLAEVAACEELVYTGKRATAGYPQINVAPADPRTNQPVCYYNTPHISLGSVQSVPGMYPITSKSPCRYWSVVFPAEPSQVLRTWKPDNEMPRLAQHRDWLLADGELSASHGLTARRVGPWDLYRVGKGLCAHAQLDGWHVFQVSDLDKHADEQAFLDALSLPVLERGTIRARALNGDRIEVDLDTMTMTVNGAPRELPDDMLHDSPFMRSRYGSGVITITAGAGSLTFDAGRILDMPADWRALTEAQRLARVRRP